MIGVKSNMKKRTGSMGRRKPLCNGRFLNKIILIIIIIIIIINTIIIIIINTIIIIIIEIIFVAMALRMMGMIGPRHVYKRYRFKLSSYHPRDEI